MQHSHIAYPPAEGERCAIGGYYPQYRISASLILRSLREENLQWIRIADREAGHVDDFQIGSQSRVDAFQVKWSQSPGTFTFGELTRESGNAPALLAQLAEGWKRLRAAYPGSRIVVHVVTNSSPSVSSSQHMPIGEPPPTPRHFAAFIEQVWKPAQKASPSSDWSIPRVWRSTWEAMQTASGLCVTDFEAFVPDCELEFGYHLPGPEAGTTRDQQITQVDLDHLTHTLFGTVASPERIIELTREQLLARLGWKARLEYRNRHEFPVDEAFYQPIEATVHQLHAALDSLPGGYIAVLGTPGSGKSTLLTQTLRGRPERIIRYYAYVPDAQDPISLHGESEHFLHDVTLALERTGCRVGASPSAFDRAQLLQRFYQQLQHLHEDWQATGRKAVILIDGLDHIAREQHPQHSFLHDLPLPNQVPEGVYIVLGSQTDQLAELPDRVQHNIRQPGHRIQMQSLPREAVLRVVERLNFSVSISPEQMERIFALSEGHPLALAYLVKRLQGLTDPKAIDTVLDTTQPYEGDIVEQYHSYWRQIEAQDQELALLTERRWEELSKIVKLFNISHMEDLQWWFWFQVHAWKACATAGDKARAVHFLEQALDASISGLAHDALLAAAEGVYRLLEDKEGAQAILQYVPQPNLRTELLSSESGLHPFLQRFRLNRLLYALGDQRLPAEIIPDPSQLRAQGMMYFERALCVVAHIWAEAWRGRKLDGATIKLEVAPLLRLFNKSWQETRDWNNWYTAQNARGEFYELLVDAVAQHGPQAIEALRTAFEREWDNVTTRVHWSADVHRKIILALWYGGPPPELGH